MKGFIVASQFLTVFPVSVRQEAGGKELAQAAKFFPLVGLLIGLISYGIFCFVRSWFPERVAALVLLIVPILLTGGLHLDGFGDFCDGFFSARGKNEILRIMKDSRLGVMGALGLVLLLLTKYELLVHLRSNWRLFLFTLTASRWVQVALATFLPYPGAGEGIGKQFVESMNPRQLAWASAFLFMTLIVLTPLLTLHLGWLILFLGIFGLWVKKKIGGVSGDILGASSEISEVFLLTVGVLLGPR